MWVSTKESLASPFSGRYVNIWKMISWLPIRDKGRACKAQQGLRGQSEKLQQVKMYPHKQQCSQTRLIPLFLEYPPRPNKLLCFQQGRANAESLRESRRHRCSDSLKNHQVTKLETRYFPTLSLLLRLRTVSAVGSCSWCCPSSCSSAVTECHQSRLFWGWPVLCTSAPLSGRSCFHPYPTHTQVTIRELHPWRNRTTKHQTTQLQHSRQQKQWRKRWFPSPLPILHTLENHVWSQRTSTFLPSDSHRLETLPRHHTCICSTRNVL